MFRLSSCAVLAAFAASVLSVAACSGGEIAVGSSESKLQLQKNGQPTGNGSTCSWENTSAYDTAVSSDGNTAAPAVGSFSIGQNFTALDGCNDCTCTSNGIMCTIRSCQTPSNPVGCTTEAKQCPDGVTYVGRSGPDCKFDACPTAKACDASAKVCPDGSAVGRTGPNCEYAACPGENVDQSKLGLDCTNTPNHECPPGSSCYSFPGVEGFRCATDPCAALTCSTGACAIQETFPAQVVCGSGN